MSKAALFLDRDGVINVDHGYVHEIEKFEFIDGIFELVARACELDYKIIVVTNQAGIGRGYFTESQFDKLTEWMKNFFLDKKGRIDSVYYCPYHPTHGLGKYLKNSYFRKPAPGMLLKAAEDHNINLNESIFIGDKVTDMIAGKDAGIGKLLYFSQNEGIKECSKILKLQDAMSYLENSK